MDNDAARPGGAAGRRPWLPQTRHRQSQGHSRPGSSAVISSGVAINEICRQTFNAGKPALVGFTDGDVCRHQLPLSARAAPRPIGATTDDQAPRLPAGEHHQRALPAARRASHRPAVRRDMPFRKRHDPASRPGFRPEWRCIRQRRPGAAPSTGSGAWHRDCCAKVLQARHLPQVASGLTVTLRPEPGPSTTTPAASWPRINGAGRRSSWPR